MSGNIKKEYIQINGGILMKVIRDFIGVISIQTFIVILLSCIATLLCIENNIAVELPTALIGIAIVFPIVFSINAAYRRREEALGFFSSMKAHAVALYYAHRDWSPDGNQEHAVRMRDIINRLIHSVFICLTSKSNDQACFQDVYCRFSEISLSIEKLRDSGLANTEVSRANQYLRSIMIDFERMRNIALYRTPTTLRAYSHVFLNTFPVLFSPYFAYISNEYWYGTGFLIAAFYGLILVSLDNIQEDLENPYDQIGADDLKLDVMECYNPILVEDIPE